MDGPADGPASKSRGRGWNPRYRGGRGRPYYRKRGSAAGQSQNQNQQNDRSCNPTAITSSSQSKISNFYSTCDKYAGWHLYFSDEGE